jgi:hypothetical protein
MRSHTQDHVNAPLPVWKAKVQTGAHTFTRVAVEAANRQDAINFAGAFGPVVDVKPVLRVAS